MSFYEIHLFVFGKVDSWNERFEAFQIKDINYPFDMRV